MFGALGSPLAISVALFIALVSLGCTRRATKQDCDAVLDRYVEMLVREHNPGLAGEALRDQTLSARSRARQIPSYRDCPRELGLEAASCALAAPDVNAIERCLE